VTARSLPAAIEAARAAGFLSLAWAFEFSSLYGQVLRYCGTSRNVTIGGDLYTARPGMSVSSIASTLGLGVDNLKATLGDNGDVLQADVIDGLWDGAPHRLFLFDPLAAVVTYSDIVPWHYGTVANIEPRVGAFDAELRDWRQALHQDTTPTHQYGCDYELGDARCRKDLTAFTFNAVAVTGVSGAYQVTCAGLAQAAGFFTNGKARFTLGANANGLTSQIWRRIRLHESGGVLTFQLPLVRPAAIADEITLVAGCTHRPDEDCRDKFDNKVNYGGCDSKPLVRELVEPGGG
jgi:uncharacterized phage protein (TIGR02218 family)